MGLKQVIIVRQDLKMGKGKACSQAAHASIEAFLKTQSKSRETVEEWHSQGMPKIVVKANSEKEIIEIFEKAKRTIPAALIRDAGRTQIEPGSITALGLGPWKEEELDKITGKLKLL